MIVIDTETTGLNWNPDSGNVDEVLQLSIIDENGNCLYNSHFKPVRHSTWDEAMAVNGITPETVQDAPTFESEIPKINAILNTAEIGGYNTQFDINMLKVNGATVPPDSVIIDAMRAFPERYRIWSKKYHSFKWVKLTQAAEHYGYNWNGDTAHDSLADCRATLHVIKEEAAERECESIFSKLAWKVRRPFVIMMASMKK